MLIRHPCGAHKEFLIYLSNFGRVTLSCCFHDYTSACLSPGVVPADSGRNSSSGLKGLLCFTGQPRSMASIKEEHVRNVIRPFQRFVDELRIVIGNHHNLLGDDFFCVLNASSVDATRNLCIISCEYEQKLQYFADLTKMSAR